MYQLTLPTDSEGQMMKQTVELLARDQRCVTSNEGGNDQSCRLKPQ